MTELEQNLNKIGFVPPKEPILGGNFFLNVINRWKYVDKRKGIDASITLNEDGTATKYGIVLFNNGFGETFKKRKFGAEKDFNLSFEDIKKFIDRKCPHEELNPAIVEIDCSKVFKDEQ